MPVALHAGFFRLLEVETLGEPAGAFADVLSDILGGAIHGIVARRVLSPSHAAELARRAEQGGPGAGIVPSREHHAEAFGALLHEADGTQAGYLDEVDATERRFAALFGDASADPALLAMLGRAAAPFAVERARSADGRPYGVATLRSIPPGGSIPVHAENLQLSRPGYDGIRERIVPTLLSYYLVLRPAEGGGRLRIHDVRLGHDAALGPLSGGVLRPEAQASIDAQLARAAYFEPELGAGDVIVFDAGSWFHRVTEVTGARRRWTYGGFMAPARDRDAYLVWS